MSLLDTLEGFTGALREAGVPAGTSEVLDATRVLGAIDLLDRPQLRAGLAAALVKRPVHRPAFDLLFDLWWPPAVGDPLELIQRSDDESGDEAGDAGEPDSDAMRGTRKGLARRSMMALPGPMPHSSPHLLRPRQLGDLSRRKIRPAARDRCARPVLADERPARAPFRPPP